MARPIIPTNMTNFKTTVEGVKKGMLKIRSISSKICLSLQCKKYPTKEG